MDAEKRMTVFGHLEELRARLVKVMIALVITTLVGLLFTPQLLRIIIVPAGDVKPVFLRPTEGFVTYMRVALLAGVGLAMPIIVYQAAQFIMPGLKSHERRYAYTFLPGAVILFLAGVAFAYLLLLPVSLEYLAHFGSDIAQANWAVGEYITFVTNLLFWVGVIFETPLLVLFLSKAGVFTPSLLSSNRKYAILASAVLAAVVTPTPDPFNMLLVMAPLVVLYEVGVWVAKWVS
jgi:sec-independent protein translocase protein TatC